MFRRLIGSILLVLGLWALGFAVVLTIDELARQERSVTVRATVLAESAAEKLREQDPTLDADETVVRLDSPVGGRDHASLARGFAGEQEAQSIVFVRVDPTDPRSAYLDDPRALWSEEALSGGLAVLLLALGVKLARRRGLPVPMPGYHRPLASVRAAARAAEKARAARKAGAAVEAAAEAAAPGASSLEVAHTPAVQRFGRRESVLPTRTATIERAAARPAGLAGLIAALLIIAAAAVLYLTLAR